MTPIASTTDVARRVPAWMTWAPRLALGWAAAYGAVRVWFATGHAPAWKLPYDLLIPDWWSAAACLASATVVVALTARPRSPLLLGLTWAGAVGWVAACALILLDLVGGVLPAVPATPRWALLGAWFAIAGCVTRLVAQAVVGFGAAPYRGGLSVVLFEGGFLLAGTVLPLLLVYRLGRIFPRWLLLCPGAGLGAGITAYFGVGLVQMIVATLNGEPVYGDDPGSLLPESFFWVAVPAYVVWGAGLATATYGYHLRTRKACKGCGR